MKLTLHTSQVHSCYAVMSSSSLMSPPLSAEAGCESRERIVLLLVFISLQHWGKKTAKVHFLLRWQAFCCMRLLNAHILAGNAARQ